MTTLPGRWALTMRTPIGRLEAEMTFAGDDDALTGSASAPGETVPLRDIRTAPEGDGEHVTWTQTITRPLRLTLDFDVVLTGDWMEGHSRAGRLPRTTVTGRRITP
ncbi:hypothetical protein GCM10011512_25300 [Tersicoccus solisilvae]|uniref:Uncharacterized protein n=1 Tax=Tersicoccus solisilvae TaxID=1882339 RepID=A0ABQ1PHJ8_9MICC|nr:hypothetical protein [Tersicoccus solisilvae]GGC97225.1 hypothetical protein GCM10011512_25300 [Tersicoccus solisilvae]